MNTDPRILARSEAAHRSSAPLSGGIHPADFVAASIRADGGTTEVGTTGDGVWHLPPDWHHGADAILRVTGDPDRLRDGHGQALTFLGSAHPLLRRAIDRARKGETVTANGTTDSRVAAVLSKAVVQPSVLLTFAIEVHSARRLEWRRLIAVLLPRRGKPAVLTEPTAWLALSEAQDTPERHGFAAWLPGRMDAAHAAAAAALPDTVADFTTAHTEAAAREMTGLDRWLSHRAADLCGAWAASTADLFGFVPAQPAWKTHPDPLERLAAFAADAANPPDRRQQARAVVAHYAHRAAMAADRSRIAPPRLLPVGLLLMLPA